MTVLEKLREKNKVELKLSYLNWVLLHRGIVQRFLDENVSLTDHPLVWEKFLKNPLLGKVVAENYSLTNEEKINYILNLFKEKSLICYLVGRRGGGKTAFMAWLGWKLHEEGKTVVWLDVTTPLPDFFVREEDIFKCPDGSVIFMDEASLSLNAREAMSRYARDISGLLAIARHRGYSIVFASQHSKLVDVNVVRMSDILFFKKLSFSEIYKTGDSAYDLLEDFIKLMMPQKPSETLFTDGDVWFKFENPLPPFWNEQLSKGYRSFTTVDEVIDFVLRLAKAGHTNKQIIKELKIRGVKLEVHDIIDIKSGKIKQMKEYIKLTNPHLR